MKGIILIALSIFTANFAFAQGGKVFEDLSLESKILNGERKYAIYLPPDYDHSQRSYPVLYLLHGGGDDQTGWVQFGEVKHIADKAIEKGTATPMIIVMPDANTGIRGYTNLNRDWRYEDFFFEELMPFVENEYRIKKEKRYRAVSGLSMGGGGTFYYALHKPELFSSACPLSASTGPLSLEETRETLERYHKGKKFSDNEVNEYYKNYSVLELVKNLPEEKKNAVRWYIDCGDDDFLYEGNSLIHIAMRKREINHEYRVHDGGHNWTYWRNALPTVLSFVSDAFHQY